MSNDINNQNGWNEYSKLVLKELQTLSSDMDNLSTQISDIKKELVKFEAREDRVDQLIKWREKIDEVATPTQLSSMSAQVEDLKKFKIQAITIFSVAQIIMGILMFGLEYIK
jgi:hypothetical protein